MMKKTKIVGLLLCMVFLLVDNLSCQDRVFPYKLHNIKDPLYLGIGISLEGVSWLVEQNIPKLSEMEVLELDRHDINPFDRSSTYNWSNGAQHNSDITLHAIMYLPLAMMIPEIKDKKWSQMLTLGLMYVEASYLSKNFTYITKVTARRKRPYLYNTSLSETARINFRDNNNSYKSFFSGHTSSAFCSASFLTKTFYDIYGKNKLFYFVAGGSFGLATLTGYYRWKGGVHYPSDIIVGAAVGSAIGYLIPRLHYAKHKNFEAFILPNQFYLCYNL